MTYTDLIASDIAHGHVEHAAFRAVTLVMSGDIQPHDAATALGSVPASDGLDDSDSSLHRLVNQWPDSDDGRNAKRKLARRQVAVDLICAAINTEITRSADIVDGYSRDDLGKSPDY